MAKANHIQSPNEAVASGVCTVTNRLILTGEVDDEMTRQVLVGIGLLVANKASVVTVDICTPGGGFYAGMGIYSALRECPVPVTTRVYGFCASMGTVIAQAGTTRQIAPSAWYMIHDGEDAISGTPNHIATLQKQLKRECDQTYRIYAERSGKSPAFWQKLCAQDTFLSAAKTIELGLADATTTAE